MSSVLIYDLPHYNEDRPISRINLENLKQNNYILGKWVGSIKIPNGLQVTLIDLNGNTIGKYTKDTPVILRFAQKMYFDEICNIEKLAVLKTKISGFIPIDTKPIITDYYVTFWSTDQEQRILYSGIRK